MVVGGEALTRHTCERWHALAPDAVLVNEYGPTETVVGCAAYEVPESVDAARPIPIGPSMVRMEILR